ncbi:DUF302 domain-containing protein [Paracoccus subflavus]|uniref:DUF302 domain-containing protein n=1 Tax=Paracoccus subflavus TaxID=2528244 RepID=A0A4Q9FYY4_9RHOB|nr:DUF302 domain-containing protein [Paracoccus subflavus]TBN38362.1 DUF302 domain-containing protein [Paracoccus subflavus]
MNKTAILGACTAFAALFLIHGQAAAQDASAPDTESTAYVRTVEGSFDDVAFAVEQAITNEGLVIDLTSHVGEMLSRTKEDVGGAKDLFTQADIFSFCSATVSRQVMEADPANIQYCPYTIFVYERADEPGTVVVGHRYYPGETMKPVNDMLTGLVDTGTE